MPVRSCRVALAVTATCEAGCCGTQVPAQVPSLRDMRSISLSPLLKVTATLPEVMGLSQSSTTFTMTSPGWPARTLRPPANCVNTGANMVGVQATVARGCSTVGSDDPDGSTTSTSETMRVLPSENDSVNVPR